ncbi:MAG TPA: thiamine pyrophosphate-dependent enzyme [Steroidobacteraceae bacterium]|jgi:pyruvate dehydrogenase (quinone)
MSKKVAEVIVETLAAAGVKHCYGVVGDTLNTIASNLSKSGIQFVHMRHEEAGAFAAHGEALLMNRLTAVAGSCGPGSLHFINGLYEANRNRAPVILIASQVVRSELGFNFIQEVDFKPIYQGCSVFCEMMLTPEHARRLTVMACQAAIAKRGVAVLIVPVDVADSDAVDEPPFSIHVNRPVIRPSDEDLDEIASILGEGENITIYAGSGAADAHDEVIQLAERLKAPIAHTSRGKDGIEYNNPYNVGMTGVIGMESGYQSILNCDTLLMLGTDFAWRQFYPKHAKIIQVDIDPTHLGRRHPVALAVVGTIKDTLQALLPRLKQREDSTFQATYVERHRKSLEAQAARATPGRHGKIYGQYLTSIIDRLADEDALFAADDGTPVVWLHRLITANGKRRMFGSLLHGTMAGGMATALGLQKAQPKRQVIALAGDGGFAMLMGDVITTIQENLPIKIAVYDNGKLGFVELEQKSEGLMPVYTDLKNPDFGKVAEAMGLWGRTVTDAGILEASVAEWLAQPGPALLNVKVAPMELVMPPFTAIGPAYGMALYSMKAVLHGKAGDVFEMIGENFPK